MIKGVEPKTSVAAAILIAGVAVSSILLYRSRPDEPKNFDSPGLGVAYFLTNAQLIGIGEDGQVLYRVNAERASQRLDDESIGMIDVHIVYEPSSEIPWDLVADTGRIPPNGNIIELEGRVLAVSREGEEAATKIRTEFLEVEPAARLATTPAKVIVEFDGRKINGTGLRADLEQNHFKLLSNVNGKFLP